MSHTRDRSRSSLKHKGIVDADFAAEKDHGQVVAHRPGLDGVVDGVDERFAAVELRELELGIVPGRAALPFELVKLGPRRQLVERQANPVERRIERAPQRLERHGQQPLDLAGDFAALPCRNVRLVAGDAGLRVGVRAAADGHEGDGARVGMLDKVLGVAGPIAADEIVGERDAVARIADVERSNLPVEVLDDQQRQVVIDRTAGRAAIDGEADLADAPTQPRRLSVRDRRQRRLLDPVGELARVAVDVRLMLRGNRRAENGIG